MITNLDEKTIETIGAIIALVSVIIAAYSVWQSSRNSRLQLQVNNLREYSKLYFVIFSTKNRVLLEPIKYDENFKNFMDKYFSMCYQEFILARQKLLNKHVWKAWTQTIEENINTEHFKKGWDIVKEKNHYNGDYIKFIESLFK